MTGTLPHVSPLVLALGCASAPPEPTIDNVLIVSFDTLRRDRLGAYGSVDGLTPNLDAFAEQAVVYERAVASANETLFSHASIFTGRYASDLGPVDYTFTLPQEVPTLAEVFGLYGYRTGAFVAGGHMDPAFGLDRGFGTYESVRDWGSLFHTVPPALEWLDGSGKPFFLVVHGYDAHHRYLKPGVELPSGLAGEIAARHSGTARIAGGRYHREARFEELFEGLRYTPVDGGELLSGGDLEALEGVYDGAVRYADAWFGELMAGLEARGRLDDTLIVVLSDHGEDLGEHGVFNHRPPLCEHVVDVPLMIRYPDRRAERIGLTTSLTEVAPIVYGAAEVPPPAGLESGGGVAFAESAFRESLIVHGDKRLSWSGLSPSNPLIGLLMPSATEGWVGDPSLREGLVSWRLARTPPGGGEPDEERRKLLQEGGYWAP